MSKNYAVYLWRTMYFPPDTVRQKQTDPNLFCGCFSLMQAQAERNPETRRNSTWTENPSTALELTRSPWYSFDGKIISGLLGWVVSFYIDIHIYIYYTPGFYFQVDAALPSNRQHRDCYICYIVYAWIPQKPSRATVPGLCLASK